MQVALPGYKQESVKKMVRHETMREPPEGPALSRKTLSVDRQSRVDMSVPSADMNLIANGAHLSSSEGK
jgi:hypothetical protein